MGLYFDGGALLMQTLQTKADQTSDNGGDIPEAGFKESLHFNFATYSTDAQSRAIISISSGRRSVIVVLEAGIRASLAC